MTIRLVIHILLPFWLITGYLSQIYVVKGQNISYTVESNSIIIKVGDPMYFHPWGGGGGGGIQNNLYAYVPAGL